jgi:hypothetical protein
MSALKVQLRKDCMKQALQMWLDSMQAGQRVVDIVSPDPAEITILVEDAQEPVSSPAQVEVADGA